MTRLSFNSSIDLHGHCFHYYYYCCCYSSPIDFQSGPTLSEMMKRIDWCRSLCWRFSHWRRPEREEVDTFERSDGSNFFRFLHSFAFALPLLSVFIVVFIGIVFIITTVNQLFGSGTGRETSSLKNAKSTEEHVLNRALRTNHFFLNDRTDKRKRPTVRQRIGKRTFESSD